MIVWDPTDRPVVVQEATTSEAPEASGWAGTLAQPEMVLPASVKVTEPGPSELAGSVATCPRDTCAVKLTAEPAEDELADVERLVLDRSERTALLQPNTTCESVNFTT